jgi:hypothetical protein
MTTLAAPNSSPAENFGTISRRRTGSAASSPNAIKLCCFAPAHGLGEVERAIVTFPGQALKPPRYQQFKSGSKVVPLEESVTVDLAGGKILNLRHLLDQAIAFDNRAGRAELLDGGYRHLIDPKPTTREAF